MMMRYDVTIMVDVHWSEQEKKGFCKEKGDVLVVSSYHAGLYPKYVIAVKRDFASRYWTSTQPSCGK